MAEVLMRRHTSKLMVGSSISVVAIERLVQGGGDQFRA